MIPGIHEDQRELQVIHGAGALAVVNKDGGQWRTQCDRKRERERAKRSESEREGGRKVSTLPSGENMGDAGMRREEGRAVSQKLAI